MTRVTDLFASIEPARHDAGESLLRMAPGVTGSAMFSGPGDCYRLQLVRTWRPVIGHRRSVAFVMMNPSTADPRFDDRTVAKITRMARRWTWRGIEHFFDQLVVVNTFAYRCTDQARLLEVEDPVGPENDIAIEGVCRRAELVVLAYGTPKAKQLHARGDAVKDRLMALGIVPHVLALSKAGRPVHPLYQPETAIPFPWVEAA